MARKSEEVAAKELVGSAMPLPELTALLWIGLLAADNGVFERPPPETVPTIDDGGNVVLPSLVVPDFIIYVH